MSEDTDAEQTDQTAEDTQVQEPETADVGNETDGGLRPIDHQVISRLKRVEDKLSKTPAKTNQINESSPDSNQTDERFERLELKTEGYNSEEVDFLMQNGGRKALDNKIAMAGIDAIRKTKKSTDATPSGTGKSTVFQKFTEQDLRKMSAEELAKIIPQ